MTWIPVHLGPWVFPWPVPVAFTPLLVAAVAMSAIGALVVGIAAERRR